MRVDLDEFEQKYANDPDPWRFADDGYEQRKYALTLACLPWSRYRRAFEPGCSIGALTERIAVVADEVVAYEASPTAATRARERTRQSGHVTVECGAIPEVWPTGSFDLIVFSEIGYYWDVDGLQRIVRRLFDALEHDGHLVAVHWLGSSCDHLLGGHEVHEVLRGTFGLPVVHHVEPQFVLDVWSRA